MKKFNITVNGVSYEVDVEEIGQGGASQPTAQPASQPVAKPAAKPAQPAAPKKEEPKKEEAPAAPAGAQSVEAPMPGNIWKVLVKEGDQVEEGQALIILEAMKMENEISAPAAGTVAKVHVDEGASVDSGDVLVSLN